MFKTKCMYQNILMIISMLMQISTLKIHASLFRLPLTRTNSMKITFRYIGNKIWNWISGDINHKVPIGSFKINLKKYIMYNYFMDIFEHWFVLCFI